ncbi:phosphoserine phosphatase SerB [Beutenbergia cavernae DSM 12333]|uniref:phosphoserine phosphatase n=1 Tax=Beutenbergia cavernae (strain ATCC BAA-8 / DSM 12333 / CCUG 43141 / JCM 11478 / NBRC 16432 / NCIMB 13614 / HKI 0122) TaxID=471853 RepID=C5BVW9_BEUC1|nr:phosphoserine phosphatase SerB [Beutenbergia cavernae]ACQ80570.1 phosphoserine phosphatase SerB [Beutenbergia cavernae DSM 12333]
MSHPRRLLVLDVDSTLVTCEVVELLAARAGSLAEVAAVTAAAMRGELDFAASLHARVATLAGLPDSVFDEVLAEVRLSPGAADLVAECGRRGWPVALVSGGFREVVEPLAAQLGITRTLANALEVDDAGRLTGKVSGGVVDRAAKERELRAFAAECGVPMADTVAIGDGANDLDMLAAAGLGIAVHAKPLVAAQADLALDSLADVIPAIDARS